MKNAKSDGNSSHINDINMLDDRAESVNPKTANQAVDEKGAKVAAVEENMNAAGGKEESANQAVDEKGAKVAAVEGDVNEGGSEPEKNHNKTGIGTWIARIIGYVVMAALLFLLVVNVYTAVQRNKHKDPVPMVFGYASLVVGTGSMIPTINVNDVVVVKKVDSSKLEVGDIVTYVRDPEADGTTHMPVTHRITEINTEEGYVRCKGDNPENDTDPYPIYFHEIRGVVIKIITNGGGIIDFFQQPLGVIILLAVGVAIIFLPDRLAKRKKEEVEEDDDLAQLQRAIDKAKQQREELEAAKPNDCGSADGTENGESVDGTDDRTTEDKSTKG
ncbi:MAG: signal peptidase I [Clostridia bacterium]|nr:signal peptidase I [Clostridia bacterium]